MLSLYNGRGQLGEALQKYKKRIKRDVAIYHTWNFLDKTNKIQRECFRKFVAFVNSYQGEIYFISTKSDSKNPYVKYKRLAEKYFGKKDHIIRLPNLIGKGICEKFKNDEVEPYGTLELMSTEDAAEKIIRFIELKSVQAFGEKISADLAYKLIQFGK